MQVIFLKQNVTLSSGRRTFLAQMRTWPREPSSVIKMAAIALWWLPATESCCKGERLVYNRVSKAGSRTVRLLLKDLSKKYGFHVEDHNEQYHPNATTLKRQLELLPPETVYINHANYWETHDPSLAWVNVLRDPIARYSSVCPRYTTPRAHDLHPCPRPCPSSVPPCPACPCLCSWPRAYGPTPALAVHSCTTTWWTLIGEPSHKF